MKTTYSSNKALVNTIKFLLKSSNNLICNTGSVVNTRHISIESIVTIIILLHITKVNTWLYKNLTLRSFYNTYNIKERLINSKQMHKDRVD